MMNTWFSALFFTSNYTLNKFHYNNIILLMSFNKIRIYISVALLISLKKNKYSLLQYESESYLLSINIFLDKNILSIYIFNQN